MHWNQFLTFCRKVWVRKVVKIPSLMVQILQKLFEMCNILQEQGAHIQIWQKGRVTIKFNRNSIRIKLVNKWIDNSVEFETAWVISKRQRNQNYDTTYYRPSWSFTPRLQQLWQIWEFQNMAHPHLFDVILCLCLIEEAMQLKSNEAFSVQRWEPLMNAED